MQNSKSKLKRRKQPHPTHRCCLNLPQSCCHTKATLDVTLRKSHNIFRKICYSNVASNSRSKRPQEQCLTVSSMWAQDQTFTHFTYFDTQSFPSFSLRISCVHLCSGSVSRDGKERIRMCDISDIYGIYDVWQCLSVLITLHIPSACWSDSLWDLPACITTRENCNKFLVLLVSFCVLWSLSKCHVQTCGQFLWV